MGELRTPAKVKIIVGILAKDAQAVEGVRGILRDRFGEEELALPPFPFTFTNYYVDDIGNAPVRAFFSYETLVDRETIVDIKLWSNDVELEIAKQNGTPGLRPVNLDPGYMTLGAKTGRAVLLGNFQFDVVAPELDVDDGFAVD